MPRFSDGKYLKIKAVSPTEIYKWPSYFAFFIKKWELWALLREKNRYMMSVWEIEKYLEPLAERNLSVIGDGPQRAGPNHTESKDGLGIKNTKVFS